MRIIRCKQSLTAILSDGRILQNNSCTDEMFKKVRQYQEEDNEFELINLLIPEVDGDSEESEKRTYREFFVSVVDKAEESQILTVVKNGNEKSMYWKEVSPLSLPPELAERILQAEKSGNVDLIETYRNFWTLTSLNPVPEVRRNLFRFLSKWGMVISKSGLFVGYRNVTVKKAGETPEDTVYTDVHSGTTTIRIGHVTSMPREKVDADQEHECSCGLHIGGTSWLRYNYFGETGLACLVNPLDVVSVPWCSAEYGKLRCCAYLPIGIVQYNEDGHVIPYTDEDGFDSKYVKTILYDGVINPEANPEYSVQIPKNAPVGFKTVSDKLLEVARKFIREK